MFVVMNVMMDLVQEVCIVGNPVFEALYNDVILDNIFKSSTNLKNCRLVCNKWNDVIHSQKPTRLSLNIHKAFKSKSKTQVQALQDEKRLVKRIFMDYEYNNGEVNNADKEPISPEILQQFCQEHGKKVVHIKFNTIDDGNFKNVIHVLENNLCPNLRRLEGDMMESGSIICPFLPLLAKLEFIGVMFALDDGEKFFESHKSFFQLLLNNAPNLLAIKHSGPFDVDFGHNKKLESIEHLHDNQEKFDVGCLKKVLTQTAKSLEKLRLDFTLDDLVYVWEDDDEIEEDEDHSIPKEKNPHQILVPFPKMPKLTSLELNSPQNGQVGRHLDNLSPKLLPSLKVLKLSTMLTEKLLKFKVDHYPALTILQELAKKKGSYQHNGVVMLSLKGVKDPYLLKDLCSFFPNLESLEVELLPVKDDDHIDYDDGEQLLTKLFKALRNLEMKELKIIIPFKYDTLKLVWALEPNYLKLFNKNLKRFYLENVNGSNVDTLKRVSEIALKKGKPDPIETFQKILLHMKNVGGLEVYFRNFMLNATTAQRLMGFITENKIPITFLPY